MLLRSLRGSSSSYLRGPAGMAGRGTRGLHDVRVSNSLLATPTTDLSFLLDSASSTSPRVLQWYSCGPTVYDAAHLGHARTYVSTDVIRRILQDYFRVPVDFALGITDVDDKIIARAKEQGQGDTWEQMTGYARPFETAFFHDMDCLAIRRPNAVLRVSEHMHEIEAYVSALQAGGAAYEVKGEGVYFDTAKEVGSYGKLGHLPPAPCPPVAAATVEEAAAAGAGGEEGEELVGKRYFRDFALWKQAKPGEPSFPSAALGAGRPGWHIECSAMTHSYFGPSFDVHSGGVDLRFPHHTNEIAQAEAHARCTASPSTTGAPAPASAPAPAGGEREGGQEWVRLWLHTGHLHIQGLKMSKSLKNFISIQDFLAQSASPYAAVDFRLFCLSHKYSATLHFSEERVAEAGKLRDKLTQLLDLHHAAATSGSGSGTSRVKFTKESKALTAALTGAVRGLRAQLADDFNTPAALLAVSAVAGQGIVYAQTLLSAQGSEGQPQQQQQQPIEPLRNAAQWVLDTMSLLGVELPTGPGAGAASARARRSGSDSRGAGGSEGAGERAGPEGGGGQREMGALLAFRSRVRSAALTAARAKGDAKLAAQQQAVQEVLLACDQFRDEEAPRLGYTVRDVGNVSTFSRGRAGARAK